MALTKLTQNLIDGTIVTSVNGSSGAVTLETGTDWQTTIQTSNFTAVAGKGYFVNTTSAEITVTLPAGVVGTEIVIQDYAGTFATNKVLLSANGSEKIQGSSTLQGKITTNNATATLVYQDATKGWTSQDISLNLPPLTVEYLVVAGGGGGGNNRGGGGGAGGLLESTINNLTGANVINISIGAGGNGAIIGGYQSYIGNDSSISSSAFATITADGGGGGGTNISTRDGGSGGGGRYDQTGGSGTAGQGNNGGNGQGTPTYGGGGGGGAAAAGTTPTSSVAAVGGVGATTTIISTSNATTSSVGEVVSSSLYFAGGGGAAHDASGNKRGAGGYGGGGDGGDSASNPAGNASNNTGGGGGGAAFDDNANQHVNAGNGGSGVVILRYPSYYSITVGAGITEASGSPFTEGSNEVSVFTAGTGNIQFN